MVLNILPVHQSEEALCLFTGNEQTLPWDALIRDCRERDPAKVRKDTLGTKLRVNVAVQ